MKKFINWLIHKFGGYTEKEYIEQSAKYEAILNAHNHVLQWFNAPIIRVGTKEEQYNAVVTVALDDRTPIEYIKRDACRKLADKLFEDGLISFDVQDNNYPYPYMQDSRLYRGEITVLLPVGFGKEQM